MQIISHEVLFVLRQNGPAYLHVLLYAKLSPSTARCGQYCQGCNVMARFCIS